MYRKRESDLPEYWRYWSPSFLLEPDPGYYYRFLTEVAYQDVCICFLEQVLKLCTKGGTLDLMCGPGTDGGGKSAPKKISCKQSLALLEQEAQVCRSNLHSILENSLSFHEWTICTDSLQTS